MGYKPDDISFNTNRQCNAQNFSTIYTDTKNLIVELHNSVDSIKIKKQNSKPITLSYLNDPIVILASDYFLNDKVKTFTDTIDSALNIIDKYINDTSDLKVDNLWNVLNYTFPLLSSDIITNDRSLVVLNNAIKKLNQKLKLIMRYSLSISLQ